MSDAPVSAFRNVLERTLEYLTGNYTILLGTLLFQFILYPLIFKYLYTVRFMDVLFCLIMAAGIYDMNRKRRLFRFALILLISVVLLNGVIYSTGIVILVPLVLALYMLFFASIGLAILSDVLEQGRVSSRRIRGAVCVYLLIGYIWGTLFCLIELVSPGSFSFQGVRPTVPVAEDSFRILNMSFFYYSFVTLTTTGYGDITPVTIATRCFSTLEAMIGQLYLAILIGRLVGLHTAHHAHKQDG